MDIEDFHGLKFRDKIVQYAKLLWNGICSHTCLCLAGRSATACPWVYFLGGSGAIWMKTWGNLKMKSRSMAVFSSSHALFKASYQRLGVTRGTVLVRWWWLAFHPNRPFPHIHELSKNICWCFSRHLCFSIMLTAFVPRFALQVSISFRIKIRAWVRDRVRRRHVLIGDSSHWACGFWVGCCL